MKMESSTATAPAFKKQELLLLKERMEREGRFRAVAII